MPRKQVSQKKTVTTNGKAKKNLPLKVESSSEDTSCSEEEDEDMDIDVSKQKSAKKLSSTHVKECEDENPEVRKRKADVKVKSIKKAKLEREDSDSDDSEDSSAEESEDEPAHLTKKNKVEAKKSTEESTSDESEDDSEEESDKEPAKLLKKQNKVETKKTAEDSDSDESEESEEEPAKLSKKQNKVEAKKTAEEEDSSSDDDEDEEEEMDDEEEDSKTHSQSSQERKDFQKTENQTIFVKGFGQDVTEKKLKKLFKGCCDIRLNSLKKYAFIEFSSKAEAKAACEEKNGFKLGGYSLVVDMAGNKPDKKAATTERSTLFVKNIPESASKDDVQELFQGAVAIRMPERDGCHKGFAFIEFKNESVAKSILEEKQGADLKGESLYLDMAGNKPQKRQSTGSGQSSGTVSSTLFVKNLSFDTEEDTVKDAFEGATAVRLVKHADSGKSKGFGFIDFSSVEDAQKAHDDMQGQEVDGRQIFVDFATPKGDRGGRGHGFRGGRGERGRGGRGRGRGDFRGGRGNRRNPRGGRGGFGGSSGRGRKTAFGDDSD